MTVADYEDGIDDARAARITANIDRAFAFASDVFGDPPLLRRIADGSTLAFREVDVAGQVWRLTAFRAPGATGWVALPTHHEAAAGASGAAEPDEIMPTLRAAAPSADDALDSLEAKLRATVSDAPSGAHEPAGHGRRRA